MAYGHERTLRRLFILIVTGSFGGIFLTSWMVTTHPEFSYKIWFGFLRLLRVSIQTFYQFTETRMGFYLGVLVIYGTIGLFVVGIPLIIYEELFKAP